MTFRSIFLVACIGFLTVVGFAQTTATPPRQGGLVLDRGWQTPIQGGTATMKDLGALLSPFAKPAVNIAPAPDLKIYGGVTYLLPLEDAKRALGITQKGGVKTKVIAPGFPKDSFFHYAFDGSFDGPYNKLYLIVDKADQVAAVQLVAEKPQMRDFGTIGLNSLNTDWHTFNLVTAKSKGSTRLVIDFKQMFETKDRWMTYRPDTPYTHPKSEISLLRLESIVLDPGSGQSIREQRAIEAVRLYLPRPIMELILSCVYNKGR